MVIAREYSHFTKRYDEPYDRVDTAADNATGLRYKARSAHEKHVHFGGRFGARRRRGIHQAIGAALKTLVGEMGPCFAAGVAMSGQSRTETHR